MVAELGGRRKLLVSLARLTMWLKPKLKGGMAGLNEMFAQYGGRFTQAQQTDSFVTQQLDSITRGSMSGRGIMQAADDIK